MFLSFNLGDGCRFQPLIFQAVNPADFNMGGGFEHIFIIIPYLVKRSNLTSAYFSDGLLHPPTSIYSKKTQMIHGCLVYFIYLLTYHKNQPFTGWWQLKHVLFSPRI